MATTANCFRWRSVQLARQQGHSSHQLHGRKASPAALAAEALSPSARLRAFSSGTFEMVAHTSGTGVTSKFGIWRRLDRCPGNSLPNVDIVLALPRTGVLAAGFIARSALLEAGLHDDEWFYDAWISRFAAAWPPITGIHSLPDDLLECRNRAGQVGLDGAMPRGSDDRIGERVIREDSSADAGVFGELKQRPTRSPPCGSISARGRVPHRISGDAAPSSRRGNSGLTPDGRLRRGSSSPSLYAQP